MLHVSKDRIPWVSRTETGYAFPASPVTPEGVRFRKCVHMVDCFLEGKINLCWAQYCRSYTASSCTWAPAFKYKLIVIRHQVSCDWQHGLGFLFFQLASVDLATVYYDHYNHLVWIVSQPFTMSQANMSLSFHRWVVSTKKAAALLPRAPLQGWSIHSLHASNNSWGRTNI